MNTLSRLGFVLLAFGLASSLRMPAADVVDNRAISSGRNDVVYLAPALYSYEALPIGNGQLGATVWNEKGMSYQLNNGSFFETPDESSGLFSSGHVDLQLPPEWMKGFVEERLSLHDAKVVTRFKTGNVRHQVRSWMAEGLDMLVIEIESDEPIPDLTMSLSIWERQPNSLDIAPWFRGPPATASVSDNDASITTVGLSNHNAVSMTAAALDGQVKTVKNDERTVTMTILSGNRKKLTILVANPLTEGPAVDVAAALATARDVITKARAKGNEILAKDHDAYWHSFWNKSSLVLHSADGFADYLENLYDLFTYWMGSSSRGEDPPKFNGGNFLLYQDDRSWGGCYWYNNTREMYWSLLPANHAELFAPFINLYWNALPNSRFIAHDLYDSTGACFEEVLSRRGDSHDKYGNPGTGLYLTTGTEMAFQMYQYYLFTKDETFLREKAYPLLKETLTFHLNFVNKENDGLYHAYPSNTRETYHWVKDSVTDLSALRTVLPILVQVSEKLGLDAKEREHWKDVIAHLAPFVEDPKTHQIEPGTFLDVWPPTRFTKMEKLYPPATERTSTKGQLFNSENVASEMVFPWNIYGLDSSPEDLARARDTFIHRPYNQLGYGIAWDPSPLCAARLGLPDEMVRSFRQYVENVQMFPSGMGSTAGNMSPHWGKALADSPAFDSAGAMADAVAEMAIQSYDGRIRVFPSMPPKWEGEFTLAAEGGFLVSSKMNRDGVIPFIKIVSQMGGPCVVYNPWNETAVLKLPGAIKEFAPGMLISFDTQAGGTYELQPKSVPPEGESIVLARCDGPKIPFSKGPSDTVETYLAHTNNFGMLGITRDGGNPARNAVKRALYPKVYSGAVLDRTTRPALRIMPTDQPPVIDGKLDDACWKDCPTLGPMLVLGTNYLASNKTEVKITYDDRNLYIAAVCSGPEIDKRSAQLDDGSEQQNIFGEESVEIDLQPTQKSYWHLAVNLAGARYDELVTGSQKDTSHRLNFHCTTSRRADAWIMEAAIPFASLGVKPKPGERWGFNFGQNHSLPQYYSTWAPLSRPIFDSPEEFGQLIFGGTAEELRPSVSFPFEDKTVGQFKNGADLGPGKVGQALTLSGQAFFEVPDAPELALGNTFTVEAWVYPRGRDGRVVDKSTAGTNDGYNLDFVSDKLRFITPATTLLAPDPIPLNTWTHLAATYDANDGVQRLFVNGQQVAEQRWQPAPGGSAGPAPNINPLRIGADSTGATNFQGMIDEVHLYSRVLSPLEIKTHFQIPTSSFGSGSRSQ